MESPVVFALNPLTQTAEIEKYCYGRCGQRLTSGIRDDIFGNLKTCNQRNCDYEIKRMEIAKGVCLRRLGKKYRQDASKGFSI